MRMEIQAENLRQELTKNWIYCCCVALQQPVGGWYQNRFRDERSGGYSYSFLRALMSLQLTLHGASHKKMSSYLLIHISDGSHHVVNIWYCLS